MYEACVENIRVLPHPNADRLNLGIICGEQCIVGKETRDGELVAYFPCGGRLTDIFLSGNDLVARVDADGNKAGGFFAKNGRVRAQSFRGERSEGFVASLDMLEKAGVSRETVLKLKAGDRFTTLDDILICEKYETPATVSHGKNQAKSEKFKLASFKEHKDTKHILREMSRGVKLPALVTVSIKMHGTSGRYGYVPVRRTVKNGFWRRLFRKPEIEYTDYEAVMGSRRVTIDPDNPEGGFYGSNRFRSDIFDSFLHLLKRGEVVYGEIVGYLPDGRPIMGEYDTSKMPSGFKKEHGSKYVFNYGCVDGQCEFYVYRITNVNEDGDEVDVPWLQVKRRAEELGLKTVSAVTTKYVMGGAGLDLLVSSVQSFVESPVCGFVEGVVFRVDSEDGSDFYKYKTFDFRLLEGILKEDPRHVDMEESS